ncbi:sestrin homolog [Pollicipes pollicipes]|uniref:sestrin homolog n=1 Tax=Pollicipes pollicipes TaxID=41117 RepID=UPI0018851767|nr:sestrin homolog [Pollicipes pollicipes]
MCCHAEYLAVFTRTQHFIMRGDGPLPFDVRHYIAIMAAGRHQSSVVVDQLKDEFLTNGGQAQWLDGIHLAPKKLRDLNEVNKILAHRPWLLNKAHIERLVRGRDNWSLGELLQALTILAHYHAVCSFVHGCRVFSDAPEASTSPALGTPNGVRPHSKCVSSPPRGVPVGELMQKMQTLSQQQSSAAALTAAERSVSYDRLDADTAMLQPRLVGGDDTRLAIDADNVCEDFSRRGETSAAATFRVQDYNWEDHGFSLVNRLYSDVGELLDEKFRTAYNLTYQTMGSFRAVDTSLFRRAVWCHIQCLFGIRHDDYDYTVVNQLLDRSLKAFIKTVCVCPERLEPAKLRRVMDGFQLSEKVHVAILCLEARLQSELLYALRAVMCYTT